MNLTSHKKLTKSVFILGLRSLASEKSFATTDNEVDSIVSSNYEFFYEIYLVFNSNSLSSEYKKIKDAN